MNHAQVLPAQKRFAILVSILLFFACLSAGAAAVARFQHGDVLLGWILGGGAVFGAYLTAPYWARVLPGILGVAALNSIIALSSGHQIGSGVPVPRAVSGVCVVLCSMGAFFARRFERSQISIPKRALLVGFMAALLLGVVSNAMVLPAVAGTICFVAAIWGMGRSGPGRRTRGV